MPTLRASHAYRTHRPNRAPVHGVELDDTAVRSWLPTIALALCALALAILSG